MIRNARWAVGMAFAVSLLMAAPALAARGQRLGIDVGLATGYDDNILEYSDNQLRDFASGAHPLRYSLESTDDLVWNPSLALTWELDRGRGRRHALRLRGQGTYHQRNGTADFGGVSARWTESFRHERRLSLGYYIVPDFYLRQLRDEDLPVALGDYRYQRAAFDLQIFSAGWRQRIGRRFDPGIAYQYEDRRYVPSFRERSSKTQQAELWLAWGRLPRRGEVVAHVGGRWSDASGVDGDEPPAVRDDDDVSYNGLVSAIEGRMEFTRRGLWRFGGDLEYLHETRHYTSTVPTDRYHNGRDDVLNGVEAGLRAHRPHWTVRGWFRFENNVADLSTLAPPTSDSGSYQVHQFGLELVWGGDLWHQAPGEEEGD